MKSKDKIEENGKRAYLGQLVQLSRQIDWQCD